MNNFKGGRGFGGGEKGGFRGRGGDRGFGGKPKFNNNRDRAQSMHQATCSECGNMCSVPFRPTGEKPVYCNDCFGDKRDNRDNDYGSSRFEKKGFQKSASSFDRPAATRTAVAPDRRIDDLKVQIDALNMTVQKILNVVTMLSSVESSKKSVSVESKPKAKAKPVVVKKSVPAVKKKAPAKKKK